MLNRRSFLSTCSQFGVGATLFPGVLWAMAQNVTEITSTMVEEAAVLADVKIPAEDVKMMLPGLNDTSKGYEKIYALHMPNSVQPSLIFDPLVSPIQLDPEQKPMQLSPVSAPASGGAPHDLESLAFWTVRDLAELIRTRRVSATDLTKMYLARLKRYDKVLHCVVTLTEERALAQAAAADREIASGKYRGPLHGIPWGAKDLLAVKGYPTTWGAGGFETQTIDEDATVVKRLDEAGAILIAKLTLGALAQGDRWFGGITRNPWNLAQGSSGSSAGPASATAAGAVAFSIGSETLGSISSPSTRCGCTGLRPTFGLVPRTGAMALSWTMDKLGPICRSVEDCALVLDAIHGPDGQDRSARRSAPFNWNAQTDWRTLRVGYLKDEFDRVAADPKPSPRASRDASPKQRELSLKVAHYDRRFTDAALIRLHQMVPNLIPLELPKFPYDAMLTMLSTEAAAAFDELTRTGRDKLLTEQSSHDWPNTFRTARFVPAVEYIQASRARLLVMEQISKVFADVDVVVTPTASNQLIVTNLTGNPAVILPNGLRGTDAPAPIKNEKSQVEGDYGGPSTPVSLTFLGPLYGEAKLLAFARAYQQATGFQQQHPSLPISN